MIHFDFNNKFLLNKFIRVLLRKSSQTYNSTSTNDYSMSNILFILNYKINIKKKNLKKLMLNNFKLI